MSWRETTLGEITDLKRGFDLPKSQRLQGDVPVYSSSGITGSNSTAAVEGPCVITGRYGTIGEVFFSGGPCWPLNTALYSTEFNGNNPRFVYYLLQTIPWQGYTTASAVPGVNRNHVNLCPVKIPDRATQDAIVEVLDSIVDKIALNNRLNGRFIDRRIHGPGVIVVHRFTVDQLCVESCHHAPPRVVELFRAHIFHACTIIYLTRKENAPHAWTYRHNLYDV